ncbi:MAG: hypothetical protein QMB10_04260 [Halioglobus sp.]|jgi:hypothetical protein
MLILKKLLIVIRLALPVGVNASSIDYTLSYVSGEQLEGHFTCGRQVSANGTLYQTRPVRGCNGDGSA